MTIRIKRAYDPPDPQDGTRLLVDRLWPHGISKENLNVDDWLKDLAPSDQLRKWFDHEEEKWEEFQERYFTELGSKAELVEALRRRSEAGIVTLIYAARDVEHNNAAALREYLERESTEPQ